MIDVFNTLSNALELFVNTDTAEKTPFIFAMKSPDGEGFKVIGSNTTHNFQDLVQIILVQFVHSMKNAVKSGRDPETMVRLSLKRMCEIAVLHSFFEDLNEELNRNSDEYNENEDEEDLEF